MISREELKELYEGNFERFYHLACLIIKDEEMAKDVVHDVFVKAWDRLDSDGGDKKGYLFRCIQNECREYLDKKKHRRFIDTNDEKWDMPEEAILHTYLIEAEYMALVYKKMQSLPNECRNIFSLLLKGFTTKQVSATLGITNQCVLNQKGIAIQKLRKSLHQYILQ